MQETKAEIIFQRQLAPPFSCKIGAVYKATIRHMVAIVALLQNKKQKRSDIIMALLHRLTAVIVCFTLSANLLARELIPLEHFAKLPELKNPQLSPSGVHLASTIASNGKPVLVLQDFGGKKSEQKPPVIVPFEGLHIHNYRWASDERLIVSIRMNTEWRSRQYNVTRLFSVGRDGKNIEIFEVGLNKWGYPMGGPFIVDWLPNDPDHVLAVLEWDVKNKRAQYDASDNTHRYLVHKVNVNTGKKTIFDSNLKAFDDWVADKSGNLRVATKWLNSTRNTASTYYKETPDASWRLLEKLHVLDQERISPLYFDDQDDNILVVTTDGMEYDSFNVDLNQLYAFDLAKGEIIGPYKDPIYDPIKAAVDKAMQGYKVRPISRTEDKSQYIFQVYSDTQAPAYYHFDNTAKSLSLLTLERPALEADALAPMEEVSYSARDGLEIPAYLTIPKDAAKKNLPLIVYPHGGPWARDHWGFDNYVQFLANRGYAVFQPQFRGSTGFGATHREAGYQQWGLAIQDDITDGVKWLIETGVADPERICIVGGSFGGYAAAMGLAKTPKLYRCGVSINGVLDMKQFYHEVMNTVDKDVINGKWGITEVSPYHRVEDITAPLLLIVGDKDTVVPAEHSYNMYEALEDAKKPVELVNFPDGEHWRTIEANEMKTLAAMEKFLRKHLVKNAI